MKTSGSVLEAPTPDPTSAPTSAPTSDPAESTSADDLIARYRRVRAFTEHLCEPLETEDYVVQSMPDASPAKWHLAHTSWFFEALLLREHLDDYEPLDEGYNYLFNSYYNSIGEQFTRACRGLVSRPTVAQVYDFRRHVDEHMVRLLSSAGEELRATMAPVVEVGLNHEQQHQELLVTDLKHMLSRNPLAPVYLPLDRELPKTEVPEMCFFGIAEGIYRIGDDGADFAYDNEGPRHRRFLEAFEIGSRLVTAGEYLEFMADGGYERAELWLSDGWAAVQEDGWRAPLYWVENDEEDEGDRAEENQENGAWHQFTLAGLRPVRRDEPVCHLSFYEADAYARWLSARIPGVRLPREDEWEVAACRDAAGSADDLRLGNFVDDGHFHVRPLGAAQAQITDRPVQMLGDVWEWTSSPYVAYPGYRPPAGALGEYNAKFMSNQLILRGGSCATHRSHIRPTYRNFFPARARWQFTGLRLARDVDR